MLPTTVRTAALISVLVVAGCVDPDERGDSSQSALIRPPMLEMRPATFKCDDAGVVVLRPVGEDGAAITLTSRSKDYQMKSTPASEGRKYTDGSAVFWVNGSNATFLAGAQSEPDSCEQR